MNCQLNMRSFLTTFTGAALIIGGVALKNGYGSQNINHLKAINKGLGKTQYEAIGSFLFVFGWIIVLLSLNFSSFGDIKNLGSKFGLKNILSILAVLLVFIAVFTNMGYKKQNKKSPHWVGIAFIIGWILLGLSMGVGVKGQPNNIKKIICGLISAALVIASMVYILPRERMMKITDGLGMPLFTLGWVVLSLCKSCT